MPREKRSTQIEKYTTVKKFDTTFASRLSELVIARKKEISTEQLAKDLGVTKRVIELWAAKQSRPDIERLNLIADYFGVTVDYLVGRSEFPIPTLEEAAICKKYGLSVTAIKALENMKLQYIDKDALIETHKMRQYSDEWLQGILNYRISRDKEGIKSIYELISHVISDEGFWNYFDERLQVIFRVLHDNYPDEYKALQKNKDINLIEIEKHLLVKRFEKLLDKCIEDLCPPIPKAYDIIEEGNKGKKYKSKVVKSNGK